MTEISIMTELIRQAPGLAAMIIIVVAFLRAQERQSAVFLATQDARDKAYLMAISDLSKQIGDNTQIVTAHDASMKVTARALETGQRELRKKKK